MSIMEKDVSKLMVDAKAGSVEIMVALIDIKAILTKKLLQGL
jgi:hypothetical protein